MLGKLMSTIPHSKRRNLMRRGALLALRFEEVVLSLVDMIAVIE